MTTDTPFIGPLAPNTAELVYIPVSSAHPARRTVVPARYLKRYIAVEVSGYGELKFNRETGRCTDARLTYRYSIGRQA